MRTEGLRIESVIGPVMRPVLAAMIGTLALTGLGGCTTVASVDPAEGPTEFEIAAVVETIQELYRTFSWDAEEVPDWEAMEALFAEGASFVAPIRPGSPPVAVDAATFLADFAAWVPVSGYAESGLHERVVQIRVDRVGRIAHAFVTFEGVVPGELAAVTRGVDSIQFVLDGDAWRLASFTTQYESREVALPARFLRSVPGRPGRPGQSGS